MQHRIYVMGNVTGGTGNDEGDLCGGHSERRERQAPAGSLGCSEAPELSLKGGFRQRCGQHLANPKRASWM